MAAVGQNGGDAAQQGQAQGEGEAQAGPDFGALTDQLQQMSQGQQEMAEFLRSAPWQQQAEVPAEPAQPDVDLSFLDVDDPSFDPRQASERLTGLVGQLVEQGVQQGLEQHINPLNESMDTMRRQGEMSNLVSEFPEMGDVNVARGVVDQARAYAQILGQPNLGEEPAFWRIMYAAGRAFDQAGQDQQGSGDPGAATLEGGGGATPGGDSGQDRFDRALAAKRGSSALPWG